MFNYLKNIFPFHPRLFLIFKEGYSLASLRKDSLAGLTVAVIAFPLSIALAIASGTTPEKGLFTAIIAGFLISFLSGSRVQIGGPTGAFVVIVFDVIHRHGYEGLLISTFMAGILLLVAAYLKAGTLIKFISQSVITGFTTGIAVIILLSQIGDIFGFDAASVPGGALQQGKYLMENFTNINYFMLLSVGALVLLLLLIKRFYPKAPGFLIVIVIGIFGNSFFSLGFDTIGDRFEEISLTFPAPHLSPLSIDLIVQLLPSAFIIALLAGVESLLSAVVADSMSGDQHHSNTELFSQGIANIGSSLFTGLPATGAIARTAVNIKAGAISPMSGIIHALCVLVFSLILSFYTQHIPFFALAAILILVAWNMSEVEAFVKLALNSFENALILLTTFILTVFSDLTVGISTGIILSSLIFMKSMSESVEVAEQDINLTDVGAQSLIRDIHIISFEGPLFFGSSPRISSVLKQQNISYKALIINLQHVPFIDTTAALKLKMFIDAFADQSNIILCVPKKSVRLSLRKSGVKDKIPPANIVDNLEQAIHLAEKNLKKSK